MQHSGNPLEAPPSAAKFLSMSDINRFLRPVCKRPRPLDENEHEEQDGVEYSSLCAYLDAHRIKSSEELVTLAASEEATKDMDQDTKKVKTTLHHNLHHNHQPRT